jgi:hypothetical protein
MSLTPILQKYKIRLIELPPKEEALVLGKNLIQLVKGCQNTKISKLPATLKT